MNVFRAAVGIVSQGIKSMSAPSLWKKVRFPSFLTAYALSAAVLLTFVAWILVDASSEGPRRAIFALTSKPGWIASWNSGRTAVNLNRLPTCMRSSLFSIVSLARLDLEIPSTSPGMLSPATCLTSPSRLPANDPDSRP